MIRTIVFDIGQVLVQFRYMDYLRDLGFDEEMSEKIAHATVLSKWWKQVDLGEDIKTIKAGIFGEHPELKDQLELFMRLAKRTERAGISYLSIIQLWKLSFS